MGMYSPGKAFVVYDMRRHVLNDISRAFVDGPYGASELTLPTAPSPVTTHYRRLVSAIVQSSETVHCLGQAGTVSHPYL